MCLISLFTNVFRFSSSTTYPVPCFVLWHLPCAFFVAPGEKSTHRLPLSPCYACTIKSILTAGHHGPGSCCVSAFGLHDRRRRTIVIDSPPTRGWRGCRASSPPDRSRGEALIETKRNAAKRRRRKFLVFGCLLGRDSLLFRQAICVRHARVENESNDASAPPRITFVCMSFLTLPPGEMKSRHL